MIEIDFLAVGDKADTGDAVTVRFTRPDTGTPAVLVIDGGFQDTGAKIAAHVIEYYGAPVVDLMVCTHPDNDHIMGLFNAFEELTVQTLLIHRPSDYGYRGNDNVKADLVNDLISVARRRGTNVIHDYAGKQYFGGALTIAGPTLDYYLEQLREQAGQASFTSRLAASAQQFGKSLVASLRPVTADPGETLVDDNGGTSARNNSSIILDLQVEGQRALFTGDAGVPALARAADVLDTIAKSSVPISFFDVPHHGSRHNVDPSLLDRLLGSVTSDARGSAFVSVGKGAEEHPRPEVANAIRRRGYPLSETRGQNIWWRRGNVPDRSNYTSLTPVSWLDEG